MAQYPTLDEIPAWATVAPAKRTLMLAILQSYVTDGPWPSYANLGGWTQQFAAKCLKRARKDVPARAGEVNDLAQALGLAI